MQVSSTPRSGMRRPSSKRSSMMSNLMSPEIPLVLAHLMAQITLNTLSRCMDVNDMLLQVELVAEYSLTYGTNAGLTTMPQLATHKRSSGLVVVCGDWARRGTIIVTMVMAVQGSEKLCSDTVSAITCYRCSRWTDCLTTPAASCRATEELCNTNTQRRPQHHPPRGSDGVGCMRENERVHTFASSCWVSVYTIIKEYHQHNALHAYLLHY